MESSRNLSFVAVHARQTFACFADGVVSILNLMDSWTGYFFLDEQESAESGADVDA